MLKDIRYGLQQLTKAPGFTLVAVVTLALGVGVNSAIFSIVNAVLLHPLPYRDSGRLAIIWTHSPGANVDQDWPSPGQYLSIKANTTAFEDMALIRGQSVNVGGLANPEHVGVIRASSNLFSILGARPLLGRLFGPDDDIPGRAKTVILGNGFWRREFGGREDAVQQTLLINDEQYAIVGVMPPDFGLEYEVMPTVSSVARPELFLPLPLSAAARESQGDEYYNVLARMKAGASPARAQSELDETVRRLAAQFPDRYPASRRFSFSVKPLLEQAVGDVRRSLFVLLAAVACVLLIACANVANLLLTRGAAREREIAIRTALGATRSRLIRQLLTECVLLSTIAGTLGLLLAYGMLDALRWLSPGNVPRLSAIRIDGGVILFTLAVAVLTGVLFGTAPALRGARLNLGETLKEGARSLAGGRHGRLRRLLAITELALSLVLLISAGLLLRSFVGVERVDPGFTAKNVLGLRLQLGAAYKGGRRTTFYRELLVRVRRLPGVESAALTDNLPLSGDISGGVITIDGYQPAAGQDMIQTDWHGAGAGYFETMKIPLIKGRYFSDHEPPSQDQARTVVIVDESMARAYWPNTDPIGKRVRFGGPDSNKPWATIVGVVGSIKQYDLETQTPATLYYSADQSPIGTMYVVARTSRSPASLAAPIAAEIRAIDPNTPVFEVKTMDERVSDSLARRRFVTLALSLLAGFALLLAIVGIYGVVSYSVAQRTTELGIRLALGARRSDVLRLILFEGATLALTGVAAGAVLSFTVTRVLSGLLFGVRSTDIATFGGVSAVLIAVSLLACYVPARRAMNVDPLVSLRYE